MTVMPPDAALTSVTSSGCTCPSPLRSDQATMAWFFQYSPSRRTPAGQRGLKASSLSRFQSLARPIAATGTAIPSRSSQSMARPAPLVGLLL